MFGATPDALIDVYIDGIPIHENYRIYAKGDRQTSYSLRGLRSANHTAKVVVKGGTFTLDGLDVIMGVNKVEVNKEKLQQLYDANQDKDHKQYTKESWKPFHTAPQTAKAVPHNPNSGLEEVVTQKSIYRLRSPV